MSDTATNAQDVVAVLGANFQPVFPNARAIKLAVSRTSKAMVHPLETGAVITDHRILQPIVAELSLVVTTSDYRATYQQIRDLFNAGTALTVQTRVDSFDSMIIEKMPHEETADMLDGVAVALALTQALFVSAQFVSLPPKKVAAKKDSDTAKRGQQQPTTPKGSVLSEWFK